jgi:hypothetical protein
MGNPWTNSMQAALLRDISDALSQISIPPPVVPPNAQTVTRYGITYCVECGLAIAYCPGHTPASTPAKDGAESGLAKRIRDCQGR